MGDETTQGPEINRIRRMLRETERLAREASLTGCLPGGARASAQQYNQVLQHLERSGAVPPGLFQPLGEEATFDEVGVAAAHLRGYIQEDEESRPGRERAEFGRNNVITITGMGALKELKELKELGQL